MDKIWKKEPIISISLDTDWASEDVLKYTWSLISKYSIKPTFFLTNHSEVLLDLINIGYIDGGIHPNFLSNSSQGGNYLEVIDYCKSILPESISFRCHRYFDVNDITEIFIKRGFKYDSNLCTYLQNIEPFVHRSGLIRFPIYFEDGAYLLHKGNLNFKNSGEGLFCQPGLMVLNFHPMHIVLNSPTFDYMSNIKSKVLRKEWNNLKYKEFMDLSYKGYGIRNFFLELLDFIKKNGIKTYTLNELYTIFINGEK
ncbi:hypothetical protein EV204_106221 [Tissierella praeacuta]|uniref:polysaccharide deacetylase WbmS family protein n=1 Tax=Tissierella praeacuta TaxID=43131 RepID=UPI0010431764|nr:hypothetical protein [Tissierella praeacuta]TCU71754.1 hypothetical protein EV204_106221 [Tissierella praeacuta]